MIDDSARIMKSWQIKYSVFILATLFYACNYRSEDGRLSVKQNNYLDQKKNFDSWLVKHFPKSLSTEVSGFINSKNDNKNNIGFYLYEFEVDSLSLKELTERFEKNALAHYQTTDTLILVVNRFETLETDYERTIPKIKDSTYLDSSLFVGLYPVPNFIGYEKPVKTKNGIWLPQGYDLYVLEAKSGDYCTEFDLKENFQMPKGWKNGFSRGVAISEKDKTVIYWGILW